MVVLAFMPTGSCAAKCPKRGGTKYSRSVPWIITILFLFALFGFCESIVTLPQSEYNALYDLYNFTNGMEWIWSDVPVDGQPWNFSDNSDPCTNDWQGVQCFIQNDSARETYHISELSLSMMNLQGFTPYSLGDLVWLEHLDLSQNKLVGWIPRTFCNLTRLQDVFWDSNTLSGPLPDCIGSLTSLISLDLFRNNLTGPIPESIEQLTALQVLSLSANQLTGTIPAGMGNLSSLQLLSLRANKLTGPLPASLSELTGLRELFLGGNRLTGPIPALLRKLRALRILNLRFNKLTGPIPSFLGNFTVLQELSLGANRFMGPIPQSLCNLTSLKGLFLDVNRLTMTIPGCLGNLTFLDALHLGVNQLSGKIPSTLADLPHLRLLDLHNNSLVGSIPCALSNLEYLQDLYLGGNALTGQIPPSFSHLLLNLKVSDNKLTGAIPAAIGNLKNLRVLFLDGNELTGSIPDSVGGLSQLRYLYADNNMLTGTLPAAVGNLTLIIYLYLSNNMLTGSLPSSLSHLTHLQSLSVKKNHLGGQLAGAFGALQSELFTLQLEENLFTGVLPREIFEIPFLASVSIAESCLHGTLPENICDATHLQALILEGMSAGRTCRAKGVQSFVPSSLLFGGTLPPCLLGLPELLTLLLTSNSLSGSIPSDTAVGPKLIVLNLGHNSLLGPIPSSFLNHSWAHLDLSHNKFNGVLHTDLVRSVNITLPAPVASGGRNFTLNRRESTYAEDLVLSLENNRLSGPVPSSLTPVQDISVLAGNLFSCRYDKSNLPEHDSDYEFYSCASNTFNIAIVGWLILWAVVVAVVIYITYKPGRPLVLSAASAALMIQLPDQLTSRVANLFSLLEEFRVVHNMTWRFTAFCLIVLVPYYALANHFWGTHTYQYAYQLSAVYTSGVAPFVCLTLLLVLLFTAAFYGSVVRGNNIVDLNRTARSDEVNRNRRYVWVIFAATSTTVMLGLNVAFVYVVLYHSSDWLTPAQIMLSAAKAGWSMVIAPYFIRKLEIYFIARKGGEKESFFSLQLLVSLFDSIAIPCLVVFAVDPNCFNAVLLPPNEKTVEYLIPECALAARTCLVTQYQFSVLKFTPPFTYSYQCSASFITSYAPTFIYSSLAIVFVDPMLQYALLRLYESLPPGSKVHFLVSYVLPRILHRPATEVPAKKDGRNKTFFHATGTLITLLTQLGILLTFGLMFPPIALPIAVSVSVVLMMTRYKLKRFLRAVVEKNQLAHLDIINAECTGVASRGQMKVAVMIIFSYCCAFYALFLFDTLGDAVGFLFSVWVLFVVPALPLILFGSVALYKMYKPKKRQQRIVSGVGQAIELQDMFALQKDLEDKEQQEEEDQEEADHEEGEEEDEGQKGSGVRSAGWGARNHVVSAIHAADV